MKNPSFLLLPVLGVLALTHTAFSQQDDFDDNNADGWTEYDPLSVLGAGPIVSFSVTSGEYRLSAVASPVPDPYGPARGAALRQDVIYGADFYLSVDIVDFDETVNQAIGLLALVQENPGIGETDGYSLTFQPGDNDIQIARVENEAPNIDNTNAAPLSVTPVPGHAYRLVFFGSGGVMEGRMYDLDDLTTPLAVATAVDNVYTSGTCGLVIFDNSGAANGTADATFDNYVATDGTPPPAEMIVNEDGEFEIRIPDWAVDTQIESSIDLTDDDWQPIGPGLLYRSGGYVRYSSEFVIAPSVFYRTRR